MNKGYVNVNRDSLNVEKDDSVVKIQIVIIVSCKEVMHIKIIVTKKAMETVNR